MVLSVTGVIDGIFCEIDINFLAQSLYSFESIGNVMGRNKKLK